MANVCNYFIKAVSKKPESLDRLLKIMQNSDPEYYLCRIYCADSSGVEKVGDFYVSDISGSVAWACEEIVKGRREEDYPPSPRGARFTNLSNLCKELGIGLELWAEETGMCIEQYAMIDCRGNISAFETKTFVFGIDGYKEGGFEEFLEFSFEDEIYGGQNNGRKS